MPYYPPDSPPSEPPQMPASSFDIQAPYAPGSPDPVFTGGAGDAGGRDTVAGSPAGAVANAKARYGELQGDTHGFGSHIGDLVNFPPSPLDPGAGPGLTDPAGHYYDPPRAYGGNEPQ
jgi:hypothetical protein